MSAEAIGYRCADQVSETAATTYASGEIVQLAEGRAGVVLNMTPVASGDEVTFGVEGIFDVTCGTAVTFTKGDPVYWDVSASTALSAPGADGDHYLGICRKTKASGPTRVSVDFNVPFTGGLQPIVATPEVLLDHADAAAHVVVSATQNPNGMLVQAFLGILTEVCAGTEDQLKTALYDSDDNKLAEITATDAGADAVGDVLVATLGSLTAAQGTVYPVIPAGKGAYVKVSQATTGSAAGAMKVSALLIPRAV